MKTFDLALKHLEGADLLELDFNTETDETETGREVLQRLENYLNDEANIFSNDYYKRMIFSEAVLHLYDLQHGAKKSFWQVACEIASERKILTALHLYKGLTPGSVYPKRMVNKFIDYCEARNPQPVFLKGGEDELRVEFFMGAFHYVNDRKA